jgi:hypothetical protein
VKIERTWHVLGICEVCSAIINRSYEFCVEVANKSNHPIHTPSIVAHTPIYRDNTVCQIIINYISLIIFADRWLLESKRTQILSKARARVNNVHISI